MTKGKSYIDAYEFAIADNQDKRKKMEKLIQNHPYYIFTDSTTRDVGMIDPNEPD